MADEKAVLRFRLRLRPPRLRRLLESAPNELIHERGMRAVGVRFELELTETPVAVFADEIGLGGLIARAFKPGLAAELGEGFDGLHGLHALEIADIRERGLVSRSG